MFCHILHNSSQVSLVEKFGHAYVTKANLSLAKYIPNQISFKVKNLIVLFKVIV